MNCMVGVVTSVVTVTSDVTVTIDDISKEAEMSFAY